LFTAYRSGCSIRPSELYVKETPIYNLQKAISIFRKVAKGINLILTVYRTEIPSVVICKDIE